MNTQPTATPETTSTDLVLQFVGGSKDGQQVTINTARCMLGVKRRNAETGETTTGQCAIYRGSTGVAVQSRGADILINGRPEQSAWLQVGDRLQLTASQTVEVVQLGQAEGEIDPSIFEVSAATTDQPRGHDSAQTADDSYRAAMTAVEQAQAADQTDAQPFARDQRFASLESSINELRQDTDGVSDRFDRLENSLSILTDQLQQLTEQGLSATAPATVDVDAEAGVDATTESENIAAEETDTPSQDAYDALTAETTPTTCALPAVVDSEEANGEVAEATAEVIDTYAAGTESAEAGDGSSLASLFSELADNDAVAEPVAETPVDHVDAIVDSVINAEPVADTSAEQPQTPVDFVKDETDTSSDQPAETVADLSASIADAFKSVSETAEDPTTAEADITAETEDEAKAETEAEAEPTDIAPAIIETDPAESVADIFARLQNETVASFDDEEPVAGAETEPSEGIENSISSSFSQPTTDEEATTEAESALPTEMEDDTRTEADADANAAADAESFNADFATADATTTEEPAVDAPAVEDSTTEMPETINDVSSVMDRLRAEMNGEEPAADEPAADEPTAEQESTETTPVATAQTSTGDESVDDYMSMLLSRMRGDSDGATTAEPSVAEPVATDDMAASVSKSQTQPEAAKSATLLTAEEFKPRRKAAPIKSFDKMRELANSSTRSAIERSISSQKQQRSRNLILQSLSLGSLALTAVMVTTQAMMPAAAFGCIFALAFGYLIYDTVKPTVATPTVTVTKREPAAVNADEEPQAEAAVAETEATAPEATIVD